MPDPESRSYGLLSLQPLTLIFKLIDIAILAVYVIDRVTQLANRGHCIDAIPEQMARIKVAAQNRPHCIAQFQHRFDIVNEHAGMHLKGELDALIGNVLDLLLSNTES